MKRVDADNPLVSHSLSGDYPYLVRKNGLWATHSSYEAIQSLPAESRHIDVGSIVSIFRWRYIIGDRTLVKGVSRQPWFSKMTGENFELFDLPVFGVERPTDSEMVSHVFEALRKEVLRAAEDANRLVILLSGGMDSRIVAGIVRLLETSGEISIPIEGFTWGLPGSRDVHYSRRITELFGWEFTHADFDHRDLIRNFEITVRELGGEIDPKHLHQIPLIASYPAGTSVLAGSYGNSVGRAEYSSTTLDTIAALTPDDRAAFLTSEAWEVARLEFVREIEAFRARYPHLDERALRELERQAHYMRRMLSHPLGLINRNCRLTQAFCSPEIFLYVFALERDLRDDRIYEGLLRKIDPELRRMPWARTGRPFPETTGPVADNLSKANHAYSQILKTELPDFVADALFDGSLESLGIFSMGQVEYMYREWRAEDPRYETELSTQLSTLVAISKLTKLHDLQPPRDLPRASTNLDLRHLSARASATLRRKTRSLRLRIGRTR